MGEALDSVSCMACVFVSNQFEALPSARASRAISRDLCGRGCGSCRLCGSDGVLRGGSIRSGHGKSSGAVASGAHGRRRRVGPDPRGRRTGRLRIGRAVLVRPVLRPPLFVALPRVATALRRHETA